MMNKNEQNKIPVLSLGFLILLFGLSCSQNPFSVADRETSEIILNISVKEERSEILNVDSFQKPEVVASVMLYVSGEDFEPIVKQLTRSGLVFSGRVTVPKGNDRIFEIEAFDARGNILFYGAEMTDLNDDKETVDILVESTLNAFAVIENIRVEYNVFDLDVNNIEQKGLKIFLTFTIEGHKDFTGRAICWFYNSDTDLPLKNGADNLYVDLNGNVAVAADFTPIFDNTRFTDLALFIPYTQFHLPSGDHYLKFATGIFDANNEIIAYEDELDAQYFRFTQPLLKTSRIEYSVDK